MSWIDGATRRRVTVAMASVTALLFGLIALGELRVNLLPDLSYPTLTVRTEYVGAAPAEIEYLVSQPIEEVLGVVKNLRRVRSISRAGQSDVILEFSWGTAMDLASLEVREKLEILPLPLSAGRPQLLRFDPSTEPVMRLALVSDRATAAFNEAELKALRRFADEDLRRRLEPLGGVAAVKVSGGLEDEVQVAIDQQRLAQLRLPVSTIIDRLAQENVNLSGGRLDEGEQRFLVRTINQFASLEEIGELLLPTPAGSVVRLRDVAEVRPGFRDREAIIRLDGREGVELAVYKEGDANTVRVADTVQARLVELRDRLPEGFALEVVEDQSQFIRQSIREVVQAALLGGLLAVLVIYAFLGQAWTTLVIAISLPLSIIATFFLMAQAGLSLNIMSLGGLALATGMLVDSSIVVLENIARLREQGLGVREAAVRGASEVGMAVAASTLTTVAVFAPLVFVEGIAGQMFRDQALTVSFSLLVALAVALTVIPTMASLSERSPSGFEDDAAPVSQPPGGVGGGLLKALNALGRLLFWWPAFLLLRGLASVGRVLGRVLRWLLAPLRWAVSRGQSSADAAYRRALPWALDHRGGVLGIALASLVLAAVLLPRLGSELIPQMAQDRFEAALTLTPGSPLASTDALLRGLMERHREAPGVGALYGIAGSGARLDANPTEAGENIARLFVTLAGGADPRREAELVARLRADLEGRPGLEARFSRPELLSFSTPLEIEVQGWDLERLAEAGGRIASALRGSPRFADVRSSMEAGHPEIQILFDQERVSALGLSTRQVADQVVRKVRGEVATRYSLRERRIDVLVRAAEAERSSVEDIGRLIINPGAERPVPLSAVAEIISGVGPSEIRRVDQERVAVVSANLAFGDLGTAVEEARALLAELPPVAGTTVRVAGQSEEMQASFRSLLFALALAVFLVYLVMASQFESLLHPLVILLTIPLALVGAVVALWLAGRPISVIVFIGVILLAGIVVNNAIVLIDRINQLRREGVAKREAIEQAGQSRLRPILMTTLTTLIAFLPLAMGMGEGAELRQPMAITVIGGLALSTLLTLLVIPVVYDLLDRKSEAAWAREAGRDLRTPAEQPG